MTVFSPSEGCCIRADPLHTEITCSCCGSRTGEGDLSLESSILTVQVVRHLLGSRRHQILQWLFGSKGSQVPTVFLQTLRKIRQSRNTVAVQIAEVIWRNPEANFFRLHVTESCSFASEDSDINRGGEELENYHGNDRGRWEEGKVQRLCGDLTEPSQTALLRFCFMVQLCL